MDKYLKVENLVSKETCEILAGYLLIEEELADFNEEFSDADVLGAFNGYCYKPLDSLLYYLRPKIEEISGYELYPTYTYFRIYRNGNQLHSHTDRESCEISVTLNLKNDGVPWPIKMGDDDIYLNQGDAAIYMGREVKHGRKPFDGDEHVQVFLHYVRVDGPYAEFKYDKRVDTYDPF